MVPSKMLSPIWGMMTSVAISSLLENSISSQLARRGQHIIFVRQKALFERRRKRNRRIFGGNAQNRAVEILERAFASDRGDFSGDAASFCVFVNDEQLVRLLHGLQNRVFVQRQQSAQVDHFCVDAFLGEFFRGFE